jgi:hypothetical protein
MEWSTGPLNLLLMDRYSWSDSPPWRCNSPICISIWWPPSVGSSRSRNRVRIRRTNQAAAATSVNKVNQVIQLACNSLASASRFPCPTWSASPARESCVEPFSGPSDYYPIGRHLRQGALRATVSGYCKRRATSWRLCSQFSARRQSTASLAEIPAKRAVEPRQFIDKSDRDARLEAFCQSRERGFCASRATRIAGRVCNRFKSRQCLGRELQQGRQKTDTCKRPVSKFGLSSLRIEVQSATGIDPHSATPIFGRIRRNRRLSTRLRIYLYHDWSHDGL